MSCPVCHKELIQFGDQVICSNGLCDYRVNPNNKGGPMSENIPTKEQPEETKPEEAAGQEQDQAAGADQANTVQEQAADGAVDPTKVEEAPDLGDLGALNNMLTKAVNHARQMVEEGEASGVVNAIRRLEQAQECLQG